MKPQDVLLKAMAKSHRVPLETVEQVFRLYQEHYRDFNVRHFHEKLRDEHQIEISYTWLYQSLVGAGLVQKRKRRASHRPGVVNADHCLACCCISTAVNTAGFRMTIGA